MKARTWKKPLAVFAAAADAFGGGGIQPLTQLHGTVARATTYQTNTGGFKYIIRRWDNTSKQVIKEAVKYDGIYTTLSYLNGLGGDHVILYGLPEYATDGITTNWYLASKSMTLSSRMQVTGTVNLVICDGVTITCDDGILCPSGSALNIYFQSRESGELIANASTNTYAAIGGNYEESGCDLHRDRYQGALCGDKRKDLR